MSIKNSFGSYRFRDYATLVIGIILCVIQIYRYYHDKLAEGFLEVVVAGVWLLLIIAPKSINDIIRKSKNV